MESKANYPECPFNAKRCFAYVSTKKTCKALENTDFDLWKGCPFYKDKDKVKKHHEDKEGETK